MKRDWLYGSDAFCEKMSSRLEGILSKKDLANGYGGEQQRDYGQKRGKSLLKAGLKHFGIDEEELGELNKGDWRKAVIAAKIRRETTLNADWIRDRLKMGTRSNISIAIRKLREDQARFKEMTKFNA